MVVVVGCWLLSLSPVGVRMVVVVAVAGGGGGGRRGGGGGGEKERARWERIVVVANAHCHQAAGDVL